MREEGLPDDFILDSLTKVIENQRVLLDKFEKELKDEM